MRPQLTGLSASAVVHAAFGLLLFSLARLVPEVPLPVVIDLSILAPPQAAPAPVAPPEPTPTAVAPPPPQAKPEVLPEVVPEVVQKVVQKVVTEEVRPTVIPARKQKRLLARAAPPTPEAVPLPVPAAAPVVAERPATAASALPAPAPAVAPAQAAAMPASAGGEGGLGQGGPAPAEAKAAEQPATAEERWRQEHFSAIKESIRKNMVYPLVARKNGWQGRVLVSFVICLDGRVEEIRIEESSGFALLDKNAIDIIKRSAPFASPPVRATLIVPIDYSLG